jgi:glutamate dehydrogenase
LVVETGQSVAAVLTLLDEINQQLGLNEIQQQIADIPLRDEWEIKVAFDLQDDLQRISGLLLKTMFTSKINCSEFFEHHVDQHEIKRFGQIRLDIKKTLSINLLPYVYLIRILAKLTGE